ncbi:hypothetical protein B0H14DRAFT_1294770 [Mycena olivaceomarginata]|nr:hypothetical protein B0H14DRAFT_1294770 [Mycena olivaceomarginata]
MRCHARSVPSPPALLSLSPQRPFRSASTPAPLARVLSALPCTPVPDPALPLRAPVSVPARQSSPAYAPLPRHPHVRCPAHSVPPPAAPASAHPPACGHTHPAPHSPRGRAPLPHPYSCQLLCLPGCQFCFEHGAAASTPASLLRQHAHRIPPPLLRRLSAASTRTTRCLHPSPAALPAPAAARAPPRLRVHETSLPQTGANEAEGVVSRAAVHFRKGQERSGSRTGSENV